MSDNKKFKFPEGRKGIMCAVNKGGNTIIPKDFPITKCPPSNRGKNSKRVTRPRKAGRILSWAVAEALAPDADLSYDEQMEKEGGEVRSLSPQEVEAREVQEEIERLKKENYKLSAK